MTKEVQAALNSTDVAAAAVYFARHARNYHSTMPDDWVFIDEAYWLCRDAKEKCERLLDLCPDYALGFVTRIANNAIAQVTEAADDLVTLAEAAGHVIRR